MSSIEIQRAFQYGLGRWVGCDWDIAFGTQRLQLKGMKSRQARLLANATAGNESLAWHEAANWLENVERDAQQAESEAYCANELAKSGRLSDAEVHARKACELEQSYEQSIAWAELLQAIQHARGKTN